MLPILQEKEMVKFPGCWFRRLSVLEQRSIQCSQYHETLAGDPEELPKSQREHQGCPQHTQGPPKRRPSEQHRVNTQATSCSLRVCGTLAVNDGARFVVANPLKGVPGVLVNGQA